MVLHAFVVWCSCCQALQQVGAMSLLLTHQFQRASSLSVVVAFPSSEVVLLHFISLSIIRPHHLSSHHGILRLRACRRNGSLDTASNISPQMTSTLISSILSSSIFPTEIRSRVRIPTTSTFGGSNVRLEKRRRPTIVARSLDLPLLPFSMSEVLVPTESKTLHLYEARYLSLLEESMKRKKNMFVHFILDPISISEKATEASFAARYGCLVLIENVERLDIGALVSIRGAGRVKISRFLGADPYLSGEVRPIQDRFNYEGSNEITSKISQVKESIKNLNSLEIKLKAPEDSPLQTRLYNSLKWAEDEPPKDFEESFFPCLQERLSFAAFQPVSGSTQSELSRLQQEKLKAMDMKDTIERLELSMGLIKENISSIAAKLAIQSLDIR